MGVIGPPGIDGQNGVIGPQGEQGKLGPQGTPGLQGEQGKVGLPGLDGAQGPQGKIGPQGIQGKIGVIGPPGIDGQNGVIGPQGEQGKLGPQGPQGKIGPQGDPGPVAAAQTCPPGQVVVGIDGSGNFICAKFVSFVHATCAELMFSGTIWGSAAVGLDLRARTNSTLHFIGCSVGCSTSSFFCVDNPSTKTLTFGTTDTSALRALVDPGNLNGDDMSGGAAICCSGTNNDAVCNSPDKPADATALCRALGYVSGSVVSVNSNLCPEAEDFSTANDGSNWSSDFVNSNGYGQSFTCTGFIGI